MTRGSELGRLWPAAAALLAVPAFGLLLWFLYGGLNRPPVILAVEIQPDVVVRGTPARVSVLAEDPDGDRLSITYRADTGQVRPEAADPSAAAYDAPAEGPIADRVTVTVADARGLVSTASRGVTIEGASVLTATPTPAPPAEPPSPPPVSPPRPASTLPSAPTATPTPTARPRPTPVNHAPILTGGMTLDGVESAVAGLAAEGHDPDGDPIQYKWDWGECAIAEAWDRNIADVRLKDGCLSATIVLTWTDPKGASASTEWYLNR